VEPAISVITAVRAVDQAHLLQAYASLTAQTGPEWEWLIQLDGPDQALPAVITDDHRVHVSANQQQLGIALTRNLALNRSRGQLIHTFDADDQLLERALERLAAPLADRQIGFSFGRAIDLLPDGRQRRVQMPLAPGRVAPGAIYDEWQTSHVVPVHCAGVMWRREQLFALGGWGGLYGAEDVFIMLAIAECWPSWYINFDTFYYRKHAEQITQQQYYRAHADDRQQFILKRLAALRDLGLSKR
jgi:glycosyltransferase involved in cell wall biosynthesis